MTVTQGSLSHVSGLLATFASYTVREMVNNRLIWLAFAFAIIGLALASFVAEVAITEHLEVQLVFIAAAYRFCAIFVMMVFVVSTIVREFNDKCLELYLSMPISRLIYFTGKCLGFAACGLVLSLIFSLTLLLYADAKEVLIWGISLTLELAIVSVFAFFATLTFNQQITSSVFITFFFYLLSRMTDTIILISQAQILPETLGNNIIEFMLKTLFTVLPHLASFTRTDWLLYGADVGVLSSLLGQTAIYCALLGGMAMWDFSRKNI